MPIFPELKPYLDAVWDALGDKRSEFVITRHRGANINLRTQFERILTKAGVKPWPKLFQNLRANRATELAGEFPPHLAAEWLGHSTLFAQKHYWQVTDSDFKQASGSENTAAILSKIVLPRRCVVERTFAWLTTYRRLGKDYGYRTGVSQTMVLVAMIHLMARISFKYMTF